MSGIKIENEYTYVCVIENGFENKSSVAMNMKTKKCHGHCQCSHTRSDTEKKEKSNITMRKWKNEIHTQIACI